MLFVWCITTTTTTKQHNIFNTTTTRSKQNTNIEWFISLGENNDEIDRRGANVIREEKNLLFYNYIKYILF